MAKKGRPSHREKVFNALPGTRAQIARKSGVSTASVGAWLAVFKAEGIAHIARWRVPRIGQRLPSTKPAKRRESPICHAQRHLQAASRKRGLRNVTPDAAQKFAQPTNSASGKSWKSASSASQHGRYLLPLLFQSHSLLRISLSQWSESKFSCGNFLKAVHFASLIAWNQSRMKRL